MFGHNEIVGQKFFRESSEAQAGKLLVTSMFSTIQGEGPHAGRPAMFVRLAKCQLACSFCDTYFDSGDWLPADTLPRTLKANAGSASLLVVTGGEPTLQTPALYSLLTAAQKHFEWVQIESNGLIRAEVPGGVYVVVSPKCLEKEGKPARYLTLPSESLARANCLKFVMSGDPKSPYSSIPDWALDWRDENQRDIFISPMAEYNRAPDQARAVYEERRKPSLIERGDAEKVSFWEPGLLDMKKCQRNYEYAARYVMEHGLRLSIQQHLFASLP